MWARSQPTRSRQSLRRSSPHSSRPPVAASTGRTAPSAANARRKNSVVAAAVAKQQTQHGAPAKSTEVCHQRERLSLATRIANGQSKNTPENSHPSKQCGHFLAILVLFPAVVIGACTDTQCNTTSNHALLVDFWNSCNNTISYPTSVCNATWGVNCMGASITEIYLSSKRIQGILPASWGLLVNLTSLHLYSNRLSGTLPASCCSESHPVAVSLTQAT